MSMADDYDVWIPDDPEDGTEVEYILKRIERETDKAYYVRVEGYEYDELFWVPKSQITISQDALYVPEWLASRLEIILDTHDDKKGE